CAASIDTIASEPDEAAPARSTPAVFARSANRPATAAGTSEVSIRCHEPSAARKFTGRVYTCRVTEPSALSYQSESADDFAADRLAVAGSKLDSLARAPVVT